MRDGVIRVRGREEGKEGVYKVVKEGGRKEG